MNPLAKLLSEQIGARIERELKGALSPVAPYLRRLGIGVALVVISSGIWIAGLLFLLISLFLYLGNNVVYFHPALFTSLITLLVAALLMISGIAMLRRPRS